MNYEEYDEMYEDVPRLERIRHKHSEPVNGHHDMLRRTENAMNRHRRKEARAAKEWRETE